MLGQVRIAQIINTLTNSLPTNNAVKNCLKSGHYDVIRLTTTATKL